MSSQKDTKIRNLLNLWPRHTLAPAKWLLSIGYNADLIKRYVSSGWFERKARGIITHTGDAVDWTGAVWGIQRVENAVVGGKTALELLGKGHYVAQEQGDAYLFMENGHKPPKWAKEIPSELSPIFVLSNLFSPEICIQDMNFGDYSLVMSNPARAMCEYLYLMEKHHTAEEAYYLMENLDVLSPKVVQETLEACQSMKVKRLFLCLAKIQQPNWYKKIDLSRVDLGRGKRHLNMDVVFDSEYHIAYPKAWNKKSED